MYNVKPFKYTRELDYILGKIIDRKKDESNRKNIHTKKLLYMNAFAMRFN